MKSITRGSDIKQSSECILNQWLKSRGIAVNTVLTVLQFLLSDHLTTITLSTQHTTCSSLLECSCLQYTVCAAFSLFDAFTVASPYRWALPASHHACTINTAAFSTSAPSASRISWPTTRKRMLVYKRTPISLYGCREGHWSARTRVRPIGEP